MLGDIFAWPDILTPVAARSLISTEEEEKEDVVRASNMWHCLYKSALNQWGMSVCVFVEWIKDFREYYAKPSGKDTPRE